MEQTVLFFLMSICMKVEGKNRVEVGVTQSPASTKHLCTQSVRILSMFNTDVLADGFCCVFCVRSLLLVLFSCYIWSFL